MTTIILIKLALITFPVDNTPPQTVYTKQYTVKQKSKKANNKWNTLNLEPQGVEIEVQPKRL